MKQQFALVAMVLVLAACTTNTVEPVDNNSSSNLSSGTSSIEGSSVVASSSAGSSGATSSGATGSSSSFEALPDVDSTAIAGPSDLTVSSVVRNKTMVLTWTDVNINKNDYSGYKVYRSDNFNSWDSVGVAPPEQQFFRDNSLDTNDYQYMYRIIAYKIKTGGGDTLISRWSNQAGVLAINTLGFGDVVFDAPSNLSIVRWAPSVWELAWTHSGRQPELGFVVQRMGVVTENEPVFMDPGSHYITGVGRDSTDVGFILDSLGDSLLTSEANWYNQDTLSEANNHLYVYSDYAYANYRVFAYYNDEFDRMISEFTSEVVTPRAYHPSIVFTPPVLTPQISDSTHVDFTWVPTHRDLRYVKDLYWVITINIAGTMTTQVINNTAAGFISQPVPRADLCRVVMTVKLVWVDIFDHADVVWSVGGTAAGTDANLKDKAKYCKE